MLRRMAIQDIFVCDPDISDHDLSEVQEIAEAAKCSLSLVDDQEILANSMPTWVWEMDGLFVASKGLNESDGAYRAKKRILDIVGSAILIVLSAPVWTLVSILIRVESKGPIFFRQTRVGLRGRPFSVLKFRTMRQDAEAQGAVWATKNDPRVTSLGRFMRKTRLDEIPQLWNVLRGEMGFVGPRPERPEFVQWLSSEIPFYELRHIIRPGITGWAQVRYQYGASLEETKQKLEYDLYYIKHLSLGLDLLIMFETIKTIILRRGAQ
jgi:exopolysaccharide biosynthesis polyprenyl glycosylphosphotransferase